MRVALTTSLLAVALAAGRRRHRERAGGEVHAVREGGRRADRRGRRRELRRRARGGDRARRRAARGRRGGAARSGLGAVARLRDGLRRFLRPLRDPRPRRAVHPPRRAGPRPRGLGRGPRARALARPARPRRTAAARLGRLHLGLSDPARRPPGRPQRRPLRRPDEEAHDAAAQHRAARDARAEPRARRRAAQPAAQARGHRRARAAGAHRSRAPVLPGGRPRDPRAAAVRRRQRAPAAGPPRLLLGALERHRPVRRDHPLLPRHRRAAVHDDHGGAGRQRLARLHGAGRRRQRARGRHRGARVRAVCRACASSRSGPMLRALDATLVTAPAG